jgi:hypothetical protein
VFILNRIILRKTLGPIICFPYATIAVYYLVLVGEGEKMRATVETAVYFAFKWRIAGKIPAILVFRRVAGEMPAVLFLATGDN